MPSVVDPVLQTSGPSTLAPSSVANFEGVNNVNSVLPPDTNGDVGPNHYVQWVNLSFAIYSRTGQVLVGPANGRTLWQGFGGPCETQNDGDPIVLYDEAADRWLMSQFALPNFPNGPFYQCIAVSQTPDPTGAYHRYQFAFSKLNDYPKFGVWPDGYYMSINQFTCNRFTCSWAGQGVAAFPRTAMLNGAAATMIYFDLAAADPNLGGMLPADLDGPAPPAGSPNYYAQFDDDAWGYSPDQLQIWEFNANWTTPSASTFTRRVQLPTAAFDSNMCDYLRNCIRQAGTSVRLDAIGDRLMYRLQYRNFGTHQTLVTNHTVDVNGSDQAGVRWYEVRLSGGSTSIHQQGTFAPDGNSRWMGSAAMDANGNLAIGYNVSNSTMFPRIGFTGRRASDPLGQMTMGEGDMQVGSGAQISSSSRWGDYSLLAVDPTDGCTFWFTTEYYSGTSSAGWRTRIGSFQIDCGTAPDPVPPNAPDGLSAAPASTSAINLSWTDNSTDESNFVVERCTGSTCTDFAVIATLAANTTSHQDTGLAASTTYRYRVKATKTTTSGTLSSGYAGPASATTLADQEPAPNAPGSLNAAAASSSAINLSWTDNSTDESNFVVERCTGSTCTNFAVIATLAANTTSHQDTSLAASTTYRYRVKATKNTTSGTLSSAYDGPVSATTQAAEPPPPDGTMHVGSLTGSSVKVSGPNWQAQATIQVVDNAGAAVGGAAVSGIWSLGGTGSASCTTDASGACTVTLTLHNRNGSVSYTVTSVTKSGLTYNPAANAQTTVTVIKP